MNDPPNIGQTLEWRRGSSRPPSRRAPRPPRPAPPDHFIALRVPAPAATPLYAAAHAALVAVDASTSQYCLDVAQAHITLAVLRLAPGGGDDNGDAARTAQREPCPDALQRARAALEAAASTIGSTFSFELVPELRHFLAGRVVYLPAAGDSLPRAAAACEVALTAHGLGQPPRLAHFNQWTPHVTVAKLAWSGPRPPRRGLPVAEAVAAAPFANLPPPPPIQAAELLLLPMWGRPAGEFYRVVHRAALSGGVKGTSEGGKHAAQTSFCFSV